MLTLACGCESESSVAKQRSCPWIVPAGYTARDEHFLREHGKELGREFSETEKAIIFAAGQHEAQRSAEAVRVMAQHLAAFAIAARDLAFEIDCVAPFTSWPVTLRSAFELLGLAAVPIMETWTEWLQRRKGDTRGLYPTENIASDAVHELPATKECIGALRSLAESSDPSSDQIRQCGVLMSRLSKAYTAIAEDRESGARELRKKITKGPTPDIGRYILVRWVWDNEQRVGWRSLGHAMARLGMEPDSDSWLVSIELESTEGEPLSDEELKNGGKAAAWEDRLKQWAKVFTPLR